ncbi:MAG: inosine/xanthosine triphosphatase [Patescibacteria group bacterium]|jgi:inosine/xanthosine triphosphatase
MKTVIITSMNPVKLQAVEQGFQRMFPGEEFLFAGVKVPSGVSDQPMGDDEMLKGARQRIIAAQRTNPDAEYYVGLEGGAFEESGKLGTCAWVVVRGGTQEGMARTIGFMLPGRVAELVRGGMELGDADDIVFGKSNSKQQNGAIGLLTHDVLSRTSEYASGVIMALVPFKNPELYPKT